MNETCSPIRLLFLFKIIRVVFSACISLAHVDAAVDLPSWTKTSGPGHNKSGSVLGQGPVSVPKSAPVESCQPPDLTDEEIVRLS